MPRTGTGRRRSTLVSVEERLSGLTAQAVMCRNLRHAWPRTPADIARLVELEVTVQGSGGRLVEGVRRMWCTGECGVYRVEKVRRNRHDRLERVGKASLRYPAEGYRLPKPEPGKHVEQVDADDVLDLVFRRMFPDVKW